MKREVYEETDLKINNIKKIKTVNLKIPETGIDSDMHIFSAYSYDTNVQLKPANWKGSDGRPEHTEYRWISKKSELENLEMIDQLKKILFKKLHDG